MIDIVLRAAWLPASAVGRLRPSVRALLARPRPLPAGLAALVLLATATLAVAYPIAASIAHAVGDPTPGGDSLALALRPGFDVVYAESIPFMLAAVGIGFVSPALAVLFVIVFVPADLSAAAMSKELENYAFQDLPPGAAVIGRLASYGLLWILAVEIPLRTRSLALGWAGMRGGPLSTIRLAVIAAAVAGALTWLWATALPLLIAPVFTWSGLQTMSHWASDPTWAHWPLLVGAAAVLAALAMLVLPPASTVDARPPTADRRPVTGVGIVRQTAGAAALALLLVGLASTTLQAGLLLAALLVAGPVLSAVLPRIPVPGTGGAPGWRRSAIALVLVLASAGAVTVLFGGSMFASDYVPLALLVVASIIAFRILTEAGVRPAPLLPTIAAGAQPLSLGGAS